MGASVWFLCLKAAVPMRAPKRPCVLARPTLFRSAWNSEVVLTEFMRSSNIWWRWHPCSTLIVTHCHGMNVPWVPVRECDNKACISECWGGGRQRHSWASPCASASGQQRGGGRMHKSADARRPDTLQAVRDISWLLAVVGCDVCHSHDGWLSDLSHYIISVRNSLFLKCLFVPPPLNCRWHLPTHPIVWSLRRTSPFF